MDDEQELPSRHSTYKGVPLVVQSKTLLRFSKDLDKGHRCREE